MSDTTVNQAAASYQSPGRALPSPLPFFDTCLLARVQTLVPAADREEWRYTWEAELWCMHHRRHGTRGSARWRGLRLTADLFCGLVLDALWLRTEAWRRALRGTAALCLGSLLGLCVLSAVIALLLGDGWQSTKALLGHEGLHCLLAVPLVLFVTSATASPRHIEAGSSSRSYRRTRRLFFAAKTSLALLLTLLLSADLCHPLAATFPATATLLQILFFVIFSIVALRWSFADQAARCKQCLRSLATPARVGRPSHNLLEWNGTEQICRRGHGMLSVPEMESSWCQRSRWCDGIPAAPPAWDRPVGV